MNILPDKVCPMRWRAALLLLMVMAPPAFPARVAGLYSAETPVEGQQSAQRNQAIVEAFRQVLVKVTGNREIARNPQLAELISNAPRYVQQYRYRVVTPDAAEPPPASPVAEEPVAAPRAERLLRVVFDEKAVNRVLRQQGVAVWGHRRPATLVWLAAERDGRRHLLMPDVDEPLYARMLEVMAQRGVPLLFPLMDLEDQRRLQVSDLWGGFSDVLWQASARYGPDAVMTGRLVHFGPQLWRAGWMLLLDGQELLWDSEGETLAMAVESGVQAGMDLLAAHYAPSASSNRIDSIRLRVADVGDLYRFARLQRYLAGLDAVERLALTAVEPEAVTYALQIRGGQRALEQGVALSRLLVPDLSERPDPDAPPPSEVLPDTGERLLRYRFQP